VIEVFGGRLGNMVPRGAEDRGGSIRTGGGRPGLTELGKDGLSTLISALSDDLGKIERFWKTVYEEFLVRSSLGVLRNARRDCGLG